MRTKIPLLIFILLMFSISGISQCYELIWAEEFEYEGYPDSEIWTPETGGSGFGNNELQYYTGNDLDNAKVENGLLTITALEESYGGKSYTSARIITKNKYSVQYGKIEARIKTPYGQGIWPAFWMMGENISEVGWPACGEIDILELIGGGEGRDDKVYGTLHWYTDQHASYGGSYQLPSDGGIFADDFHTFSVEWTPSSIRWFIDDKQFHIISITEDHLSEFHQDFFILLNLAVGGTWPGNPDASTVFPQTLEVDYVRVYKKSTDIQSLEINGKDELPVNAIQEKYSLPESAEWAYSWTVPTGVEILAGQGTNEVTVNWACTEGDISCEVTGACTSYTFSKNITTAEKISGPLFIDENEQDVMFTIPTMHGTSYSWTVPEDASIISGADKDTILLDWGSEFTAVSVEYTNSCGTSTASMEVLKTGQYAYPDINTPHKIPGNIEAVDFDYGGKNVAFWDSSSGNLGEGPRQDSDVDTEYSDNGNPNVGWITNGEYLEYSIDVDSSSYYQLNMRVATDNSSGGPFSILLNGVSAFNGITVPNTGGWDKFITLDAGTFEIMEEDTLMKLFFNKGGFNLGKMTFTPTGKPESIDDFASEDIVLGPVPSNNYLNIMGLNHDVKVSIFDINGRIIQNLELNADQYKVDISAFCNGIYMIRISDQVSLNWLGKFIKI